MRDPLYAMLAMAMASFSNDLVMPGAWAAVVLIVVLYTMVPPTFTPSGEVTACSAFSWAAQQLRLADNRRSPLAMR